MKQINGIIFGATGKIGSKISLMLAKKGVNLVLHGKSKNKLKYLNDQIIKVGKKPILLNFDVSKQDNYKDLGIILSNRIKKMDFYINAVGYIDKLCPLTDLTFEDWDKLIEINLSSNWKLLKEIEPLLRNSEKPKVLFFTDKSISDGKPYFHAFAVAKAGLESLAETYANEKKKFFFHIEVIEFENMKTGVFKKNYNNCHEKEAEKKINANAEYIENIIFEKV